ncbi:hypothetical protein KY290_002356 [Solanum tuberosum]|uniref:Uncharacterized protein n=1 Tax=Solanum tuberosum TaxID=4113 RepID=A0ABQ7WRR4_SOLTU|nr:hypothetical protein KY289_002518 [Solanum tuberosum]KAH0766380.1 hypothetical protein KY285_002251 [Solanum tuberosum]KAH0782758.1 hypothetical protein KY290_002356 [Solanum tuberosum]
MGCRSCLEFESKLIYQENYFFFACYFNPCLVLLPGSGMRPYATWRKSSKGIERLELYLWLGEREWPLDINMIKISPFLLSDYDFTFHCHKLCGQSRGIKCNRIDGSG